VKLFADYSKLSIEQLEEKIGFHEEVVRRLKEKKFPRTANQRVLVELKQVLNEKKGKKMAEERTEESVEKTVETEVKVDDPREEKRVDPAVETVETVETETTVKKTVED